MIDQGAQVNSAVALVLGESIQRMGRFVVVADPEVVGMREEQSRKHLVAKRLEPTARGAGRLEMAVEGGALALPGWTRLLQFEDVDERLVDCRGISPRASIAAAEDVERDLRRTGLARLGKKPGKSGSLVATLRFPAAFRPASHRSMSTPTRRLVRARRASSPWRSTWKSVPMEQFNSGAAVARAETCRARRRSDALVDFRPRYGHYSTVYERSLLPSIEDALGDTPVVMVVGPRQAGKTTLVKAVAAKRPGTSYVTLDNLLPLEAARADPVGFVAGLGSRAVVIDEIQKAPDLLPAIKASVNRDRRPGRFLLTGSASVLTLPGWPSRSPDAWR